MAEYIERKAIFDAYEEVQRRNGPWRFETLIESVPSVDVAPVVHGRWKYNKYVEKYECTECGHFVKPGTDRNFCSNCGAKMDMEHE